MRFPQPKRCSHCGQPIDKTPVRWCMKCKQPMGRHDKWMIVKGRGLQHRDCKNPDGYPK